MSRQPTTEAGGIKGLKSLPPKKSLGQTAYEKLRQAVVRGDFPPASHLVENSVAAALGISRTPVREAIHKLEREGLLERFPSGGYCVAGLSRQDIEETFGIRAFLESYAAKVATLRHKEKELLPLEEKIRQYQDRLDEERIEELTLINTDFHDLLYGLSRSPKLIRMINELRDPVYRFRKLLLGVEGMARLSNEDHSSCAADMRKAMPMGSRIWFANTSREGGKRILRHFDLNEEAPNFKEQPWRREKFGSFWPNPAWTVMQRREGGGARLKRGGHGGYLYRPPPERAKYTQPGDTGGCGRDRALDHVWGAHSHQPQTDGHEGAGSGRLPGSGWRRHPRPGFAAMKELGIEGIFPGGSPFTELSIS